jgi:exopolyphosphatase/guanosine-5'-triphosphate,3'-diphosphate pyrophosphatase
MTTTRRAVIDVGTNSVKLLVADVCGGNINPLTEHSRQTRLGQGLFKSNRLQATAISQTAEAVANFLAEARSSGAASVRVIATSAAREAKNAGDLVAAIEKASGLKVEIISGELEADWVFQGVATDPELRSSPLLLLDVGGGSTEFILGRDDTKYFRQSFPLGTVRLLEQFPPGDPPTIKDLAVCRDWIAKFLLKEVRPTLAPALDSLRKSEPADQKVLFAGTGGTVAILARMEGGIEDYDRARIESTRLTRAQVRSHVARLWSLPLAERKRIVGLPEKRADVILMGVVIYEGVMAAFAFNELRVSTRGLRFAAVAQE